MDPIAQLALATGRFPRHAFHPEQRRCARRSSARRAKRRTWGLYTLVAFAAIGWMVYAYKPAPVLPLWPGLRLLPAIAMPFAFILIVCGVAGRNPTAVGPGPGDKGK
jgi:uncharacterized membrane protein